MIHFKLHPDNQPNLDSAPDQAFYYPCFCGTPEKVMPWNTLPEPMEERCPVCVEFVKKYKTFRYVSIITRPRDETQE